MRSNQLRSGLQFSAKPCSVTPCATRMPIAAILRSGASSVPASHTPLRPSTRPASSAEVATDVDEHRFHPAHVRDDVDGVGSRTIG